MSKLWGGRFASGQDPFFERFNQSLAFDQRLVVHDLHASIVWAKALCSAGVLSQAEAQRLMEALTRVGVTLERDASVLRRSDAEDVHSFVEQTLQADVGDLARKLHTGRSRNDQVATDLRLYVKERGNALGAATTALLAALLDLAQQNATLPIPGFTHLQRAQPITVGHQLLAYMEMLDRDRGRLRDALARADQSPLGSGALAGTGFPVDRAEIASDLGFAGGPTRNSIDAVSDRDFVCEIAFCCSMILLHLSRLAEDWIFQSSFEAGYLRLGDAIATGSSLMPQKKNPDALELVRGKTGRVFGHLHGLLVTMKGLPLAYDKDMQEDKEALFDTIDTTIACLQVTALVARNVRYDAERCAREAARGYLNATDLADLLVQSGVPFRDAHYRAGLAVRAAIELGVELADLPANKRRDLMPEIDGDLHALLSVEACLARRSTVGGTAPQRVQQEIEAWQRRLGPQAG